jgi:hypothetical protein
MSATPSQLLPAIEVVLRTTESVPVPDLKKADLVQLAVDDFANRGIVRGALLRVPGLGLAPLVLAAGFNVDEGQLAVLTHIPDEPLTQVYAQFRGDLQAIVHGKVTPEMRTRIADIGRMVLVESPIVKGRRLVTSKLYLPTSLSAALAYVLGQLMKAGTGEKSDLRHCRLPSCGRFFFSSKESSKGDGAPLRRFCKGHGEEYRRLTSKDRTAASRRGITVEEYRARKAQANN